MCEAPRGSTVSPTAGEEHLPLVSWGEEAHVVRKRGAGRRAPASPRGESSSPCSHKRDYPFLRVSATRCNVKRCKAERVFRDSARFDRGTRKKQFVQRSRHFGQKEGKERERERDRTLTKVLDTQRAAVGYHKLAPGILEAIFVRKYLFRPKKGPILCHF